MRAAAWLLVIMAALPGCAAHERAAPPATPVAPPAPVSSATPVPPTPVPPAPVTSNGRLAMKAVLRVAARAWNRLDPGSVVESATETVVPSSGRVVKSPAERQTLKKRAGERLTIGFELGRTSRALEGELRAFPADDALAESIAQGAETIEVPAGSFECRRFRASFTEGDAVLTVDLWVSDLVPVPVETRETSSAERTKTTLVRAELKPRAPR